MRLSRFKSRWGRMPGRCLGLMLVLGVAGSMVIGCDSPSIEVRPAPISVESETVGSGREALPGNMVEIDYRITLPSGEEVMSETGYRFQLGQGAVIAGIDAAVEGMRVGGTRTIRCPPHLHWGRPGYGDGVIPPNTTLTIEIHLRRIG